MASTQTKEKSYAQTAQRGSYQAARGGRAMLYQQYSILHWVDERPDVGNMIVCRTRDERKLAIRTRSINANYDAAMGEISDTLKDFEVSFDQDRERGVLFVWFKTVEDAEAARKIKKTVSGKELDLWNTFQHTEVTKVVTIPSFKNDEIHGFVANLYQVMKHYGEIADIMALRVAGNDHFVVNSLKVLIRMHKGAKLPTTIVVKDEKINLIWDGAPASCTYCKIEGHWKSECPELTKQRKRNRPDRYREIKQMIAEGKNQIEQERQKEMEMNKELEMQNELENQHEKKRQQEQEKHQEREKQQKEAEKEAENEADNENENEKERASDKESFDDDYESRMDEGYDSEEEKQERVQNEEEARKQAELEKAENMEVENIINEVIFNNNISKKNTKKQKFKILKQSSKQKQIKKINKQKKNKEDNAVIRLAQKLAMKEKEAKERIERESLTAEGETRMEAQPQQEEQGQEQQQQQMQQQGQEKEQEQEKQQEQNQEQEQEQQQNQQARTPPAQTVDKETGDLEGQVKDTNSNSGIQDEEMKEALPSSPINVMD